MFAVGIVYLGLMSAFLGTVSLIKPLWFLGIPNRERALVVIESWPNEKQPSSTPKRFDLP
jgi:hypothetical protein